MSYGYFQYLPGRSASDEVLCNKAFNFAKSTNGLINLKNKIENKIMSTEELAAELHKPISRKLGK